MQRGPKAKRRTKGGEAKGLLAGRSENQPLQRRSGARPRAQQPTGPLTMRCAILLALAVAAVDARGGGGGWGGNNGAQTADVSLLQVRYA